MAPTAFDDIALEGEAHFDDEHRRAIGAVTHRRTRRRRAAHATGAAAVTVTAAGVIAVGATQFSSTDHSAGPAASPRAFFNAGDPADLYSNAMIADCTPDVTIEDVPKKWIPKVSGSTVVELKSGAACDVKSIDDAPIVRALLDVDAYDGGPGDSQVEFTLGLENLLTEEALEYDPASVRVTMTAPEPAPRIEAFTQLPSEKYYGMTGFDPLAPDAGPLILSVANELPFAAPDNRALSVTSTARARIEASDVQAWTFGLGALPDPSIEGGYEKYVESTYPEMIFDWRSLLSDHLDEVRFTVQLDVLDPNDPAERITLVVRDPILTTGSDTRPDPDSR